MASSPASGYAPPPPMSGMLLAVTAVALALGTFMQVLDTTIANVSIPTIAGNLGVSANQGTWVITSFAVANGISVPLTGWLMGRYGVVRTFVVSVVLFTVASLLCGLAWNLTGLIAFRILQGAVSGPMIPGSQALLLMIFPPQKRGMALAIWSMTTLAAPIFGPILGGYISDNISWPWIFLINVPVGVVCAVVCWRNLKDRETPTQKLPVDTIGFSLLVLWVGALQIMLDTGKDLDWFASSAIVVEAIIAVVAFVAWLIWELTTDHPIVDLSLFRSRNFALSVVAMCLAYGIFFGNNLLMPLWLQTQMGYVATWAGLVAAPAGVIAVIATPIFARGISRIDARIVASLSLAGFALSYFMRSLYTAQADFWALAAPGLIQGVSMSVFFIAMITLMLNGVPGPQVPMASGLSNFLRITAGSFAASMVTTIYDQNAAVHQTRLAEILGQAGQGFSAAAGHLQALGLSAQQAAAVLLQQVTGQAYLLAVLDFFRVSAWLTLLLIPMIWLTDRAVSQGPPPAMD